MSIVNIQCIFFTFMLFFSLSALYYFGTFLKKFMNNAINFILFCKFKNASEFLKKFIIQKYL